MNIEILNEIKGIIAQEKCKDSECVSLYDVLTLVRSKRRNYNRTESEFEDYLEVGMGEYCRARLNPYSVKVFNFKTMGLDIGYRFDYATFVKINGDLFLQSSQTYKGQDLLSKCGQKISEYYDNCLQYQPLFTQISEKIKGVNCNFLITINSDEITIQENKIFSNFKLSANAQKNEYDYTCNSNTVISAFRNKEAEILSKIFIRIEDCPEWTKGTLYEMRKNQLEKELKQEKRLELKRKLFPFLKK